MIASTTGSMLNHVTPRIVLDHESERVAPDGGRRTVGVDRAAHAIFLLAMCVRPRRWPLGLVLVAVVTALLIHPAVGAAAGPLSAVQRLAATYSPITMVREQRDPPCEPTEEQYQPTSVD